jgi:hypothetical protein
VSETPDPPVDSGSTRYRRDRRPAALALASGQTIAATALACGVSERSVRVWLKDAAFVRRVEALRAELFAAAVGKLTALSGRAVDTLGRLLRAKSDMARLGAARAILEAGPRLRGQLERVVMTREPDRLVRGEGSR